MIKDELMTRTGVKKQERTQKSNCLPLGCIINWNEQPVAFEHREGDYIAVTSASEAV